MADFNTEGLLNSPMFLIGMGLLGSGGTREGLLHGLKMTQAQQAYKLRQKESEHRMGLLNQTQQEKDDRKAAMDRLGATFGATQIPGQGPLNSNPQPAIAPNPMMQDMARAYPDIMGEIMKASMIPTKPKVTDDMAEYKAAKAQGFTGTLQDWMTSLKKAGASRTNVTVGGEKLTPGQKKLDEIYAQQFADFGPGGQFADSKRMIRQIGEAKEMLANNDNLTGPIVGHTPDFLLSFVNPESLSVREGAEEVIQRNLRAILGPQFTEKEGERLIARAYNPKLSEAENIKRLDRVLTQMVDAYNVKKSAADNFFKNGTLRGWEGKLPTIDDFYSALSNTSNETRNNDPLGLR